MDAVIFLEILVWMFQSPLRNRLRKHYRILTHIATILRTFKYFVKYMALLGWLEFRSPLRYIPLLPIFCVEADKHFSLHLFCEQVTIRLILLGNLHKDFP